MFTAKNDGLARDEKEMTNNTDLLLSRRNATGKSYPVDRIRIRIPLCGWHGVKRGVMAVKLLAYFCQFNNPEPSQGNEPQRVHFFIFTSNEELLSDLKEFFSPFMVLIGLFACRYFSRV